MKKRGTQEACSFENAFENKESFVLQKYRAEALFKYILYNLKLLKLFNERVVDVRCRTCYTKSVS